jgi:GPH family glycoside/pentoside/hexuronide:cation symporter
LLVRPNQRTPIKTDLGYAMITLGSTTLWSVSNGWLLYFYLPPKGASRVPVASYGLVMFALYVLHAIAAPPIGYFSDHTRSRWGRRLPFMFLSTLPLLVFFVLLWTPPAPGTSAWNLVYLGIIALLYRLTFSLHQIPYQALLPELALTERPRTRMSAWYAGFQLAGMVLGGLAGPMIENLGYVRATLIYASVMLPLLYLPLFVLRERPGRQIAVSERLDFWQSLSITLRNRAFLFFVTARTLCWSALTLIQMTIPFIVTEICQLTKSDTLSFYIPTVLTSLACYPLVTWLSGRVGKWGVFAGSLLASALVLPGLMLIGPWFPVPLSVQGILWVMLQAIGVSGFAVLQPAFMAEITDDDERLTGQRREGTYYAAWRLLDHVVTGAVTALLPLLLLLGRSHSDPNGPLGVRLVGVVGGALILAAFALFLRYPLRQRPGDTALAWVVRE